MTPPPHTQHCRVGPPMPGYLAVYGPPDADGAEPVVALVPATNPRAAADARLFAGAWRLRATLDKLVGHPCFDSLGGGDDADLDAACDALDAADGIELTPAATEVPPC
jgi:hypothetical protein